MRSPQWDHDCAKIVGMISFSVSSASCSLVVPFFFSAGDWFRIGLKILATRRSVYFSVFVDCNPTKTVWWTLKGHRRSLNCDQFYLRINFINCRFRILWSVKRTMLRHAKHCCDGHVAQRLAILVCVWTISPVRGVMVWPFRRWSIAIDLICLTGEKHDQLDHANAWTRHSMSLKRNTVWRVYWIQKVSVSYQSDNTQWQQQPAVADNGAIN